MPAIAQTTVTDYRLPVFSALGKSVSDFAVIAGQESFDRSVPLPPYNSDWICSVRNVFLLRRSCLWQRGALSYLRRHSVVVLDWNPRNLLTTCAIRVLRNPKRRIWVWGHAWGSGGPGMSPAMGIRMNQALLADGVIAYTQSQAEFVSKRLKKSKVVYLGNSCVSKSECKWNATSVRTNVICVSRLIPSKKVELLVRAFALAQDKLPREAHLHIVGSGPCESELRNVALSLGIKVSFHGYISCMEKLRQIYEKAFVSVSPGYVGLSAIQAMSQGVPVIAADAEPHSPEIEACVEGQNARYFQSDNAVSLAEAIASVWNERDEWFSRGFAISADISQRYSYEHMVRVLGQVLQGRRAE
jgi:glycosyltransferase involved in cell wall biosynthesis